MTDPVNHSLFHQTNGMICIRCDRMMSVTPLGVYCPGCLGTEGVPAQPCPWPEMHA